MTTEYPRDLSQAAENPDKNSVQTPERSIGMIATSRAEVVGQNIGNAIDDLIIQGIVRGRNYRMNTTAAPHETGLETGTDSICTIPEENSEASQLHTQQAQNTPQGHANKTTSKNTAPRRKRGHPMKQVKADLAQKGKLNAKKPMPKEQKRARRKKRKK